MYGNVLFPKESKSNQNKKPKRRNAVSRLMRDLKEWEQCKQEFPCIGACPLDDNIMEWHCNICPDSGDFKNIVFHLIINFDETYPTLAPKVKLCTPIPHPNVFGEWICLDMIKRQDFGRYKGWTAAYSVTSILMQLQSFLFEQKTIDQMDYDGSRERYFNESSFNRHYLPKIKKFYCNKCKHCWYEPFPSTPSMYGDSGVVAEEYWNDYNYRYEEEYSNDLNFCFWDGIYRDLEFCIFEFFNVQDLLKLRRVAKRFQTLVFNTKIIQKDSIKCWFHRSPTLKLSSNDGNETTRMLCLGYGVIPTYFKNDYPTMLYNQLFGSSTIRSKIGNCEMIQSIDVTFDLLSSDAFDNFNIRKTVFNDTNFEHFLPLYLNNKHGKIALKEMDRFVLKIFKADYKNKCHPWLKLLTVANCMKSLIVSVMQDSDNSNGKLSLHYSINVLETFFRLHHTLLAIYFNYKNEIGSLLQYQIDSFFQCDRHGNYFNRNKQNYPDLGIFLSYLTLWEKNGGVKWDDIATAMLCETFTRQVKWVLNAHKDLVHPNSVSPSERAKITWKQATVSNRLFMFNTFFFQKCCRLGEISLKTQFDQYNDNFGFPQDESLASKLQTFVKKISNNVNNYEDFYNVIGLKYPGTMNVGVMLKECMRVSEKRGYHKASRYGGVPTVAPQRERKVKQEPETNAVVSFRSGIETKVFKWGQQKTAKSTTTTVRATAATSAVRPGNGIARQANMNLRQQQHQQQQQGPPQQTQARTQRERREVVQARGEIRRRNNSVNERQTSQRVRQQEPRERQTPRPVQQHENERRHEQPEQKETWRNSGRGLENELKEWLKTEGDFIQHNLLNRNLSPYTNGERKTIESQIYSARGDIFNRYRYRPNVTFEISTIKNGVMSNNVNEILLDCEIVRVLVIVAMRTNGINREIDYFDKIYFDGESTVSNFGESRSIVSYPDRSLDGETNIGVHGPFKDKHGTNNVIFYSDFSVRPLCSRFGENLKNGITPRVHGYTKDGSEFYCCGGYDYLIHGKLKQAPTCVTPKETSGNVEDNRRSEKCAKREEAESKQEEKDQEKEKEKEKTRPRIKHLYGMSRDNSRKKKNVLASRSSSGDGWLKISREAESDTRNLYDFIFNKEEKKLVVKNDRNLIDLDGPSSPVVNNDKMKKTNAKKKKKKENKNETNEIANVATNNENHNHKQKQVQKKEGDGTNVNVVRDEILIPPRGKPHGMHNDAIPRRPPIKRKSNALLFKNVNKINNGSNNNFDLNFDEDRKSCVSSMIITTTDDNLSIVTKKRHHRSRKGKTKNTNTNANTSINRNKK